MLLESSLLGPSAKVSEPGAGRAAAFGALLQWLDAQDYDFVPPTPATHARVLARPGRDSARDIRDIFGWSRPFDAGLLPAGLFDTLFRAGLVEREGDRCRAAIRAARLRGMVFVHSAYPTDDRHSVFLGPDSYRFADLIAAEMPVLKTGARILDYGAGAGVGGLTAARIAGPEPEIVLADVNAQALEMARANAAHAGVAAVTIAARGPDDAPGAFDLILMNPPYLMDKDERAYRHGGGLHGGQLSVAWAAAGAGKLAPGGRLILYTGAAIVDGVDVVQRALAPLIAETGCSLRYRMIDPDIFGEELESERYRDVERIAVVAAVIDRPN